MFRDWKGPVVLRAGTEPRTGPVEKIMISLMRHPTTNLINMHWSYPLNANHSYYCHTSALLSITEWKHFARTKIMFFPVFSCKPAFKNNIQQTYTNKCWPEWNQVYLQIFRHNCTNCIKLHIHYSNILLFYPTHYKIPDAITSPPLATLCRLMYLVTLNRLLNHDHDRRSRNWFQNPVADSGTGFWYQM